MTSAIKVNIDMEIVTMRIIVKVVVLYLIVKKRANFIKILIRIRILLI